MGWQKTICELAGGVIGFCGGYSVRKFLCTNIPEGVNETIYRVGVYGLEVAASAVASKYVADNFNGLCNTVRALADTAKPYFKAVNDMKEAQNDDNPDAGRVESEAE